MKYIPYIEIIDAKSLKKIKKVEPQECWFELSYYDVGQFQIYCRATQNNLDALKKWRYVKIPNKPYVWLITAVRYTFTAGGTRMISATGYDLKWLLHLRIIQKPIELLGTITSAIYKLVNNNLGTGASIERKIEGFTVDTNDLLIDISGTQAPRGNLLEFVNNLLKTYNCGSIITYENETLKYKVLNGSVKTRSVIFSQSFDNLLSSEYLSDDEALATNALVVSTIEELDYELPYDTGAKGIERKEILISSNLSTKYVDANGAEKETTPTSALYRGWQEQEAVKVLAENTTLEEIKGEIDLVNSSYEFETDFFIGDMVRIQDEYFNFYANARILKYTFKQDANGYGEEAEYSE